ncbi:holin [Listeria monocytogenes]|nr:holin [Listeria monocytogenes]
MPFTEFHLSSSSPYFLARLVNCSNKPVPPAPASAPAQTIVASDPEPSKNVAKAPKMAPTKILTVGSHFEGISSVFLIACTKRGVTTTKNVI